MSFFRLVLRGLLFHWRGNSAVALGVAVGTAVLTGALFVGDSLRGSLRDLTLERLGWIDQAAVAGRFFRAATAAGLPAGRVAPAVVLRGTAAKPDAARAVRQVNVLGVDGHFWPAGGDDAFWDGADAGAVINPTLAEELGVRQGDEVAFRVQKASAVPRETLLGRRDAASVVDEIRVKVRAVLPDHAFGDRFSLQPAAEAPRNAYLPLRYLQGKLDQPGRVNAVFAGDTRDGLRQSFRERLTLDDWGLTLHDPAERVAALFAKLDRNRDGKLERNEYRDRMAQADVAAIGAADGTLTREAVEAFYRRERNYLALESRQLILEPSAEAAALAAAKEKGLRAAPTLVYLANAIAAGGQEIPYSVVAALDPAEKPPLGPFLPDGVAALKDAEIVLADWKDSPLKVKPGDAVTVRYFDPEQHGEPVERTATFRLAGFVPLRGVAADTDLTPAFPGITDKLTLDQWDPPFPYDNKRVKPRDEKFWKEHRTTPKAYVTLARGQELWASRFGKATSIRFAPAGGGDASAAAAGFGAALLDRLDPEQAGLAFQDTRQQALAASQGGGFDFGQLFLGFSFFLIAAALLLVGLLFRLNLDRRAAEVGLLLAAGYRRRTVRWLFLAEGTLLAVIGAAVGCAAATAYAAALVQFLAAYWPGGALASFLRPHYTAASLATGSAASLVVSVLTVAWAVRVLGRVAPNALLAGRTAADEDAAIPGRPRWSRWVAGVCAVVALGLVAAGGKVRDPEAQAGTFFGGGMLLLTACLAAAWAWMRGSGGRAVSGHGATGIARLGVRNAARHPVRSLLTAGLLASAAFLVVAVDAFRRDAGGAGGGKDSPSGGFALLAESDLPVFQDLNTPAARDELRDRLVPQYRKELNDDNAAAERRADEARALLQQTTVYPFRVRAGDDVSCLNLYQPRRPRLLGVPGALIQRGGFQFAAVDARDSAQVQNPWVILSRGDSGALPAFGENNTVVWMLKKGLEDTVDDIPTGQGTRASLRIDGLLRDSVFQSGLLVSEANFFRLYPVHEGYNFFLIEPPPGREAEVKQVLETALADRGFEVTPAARRLESYLAVENTYLSTFQALGGLGLVLGSLGLAVVLLRGVWERRGELALLRALGFRRGALGWLVLAENGFLLLLGLAAGTLSALLAVAPHLAGGAGAVPWAHLLGLLAAVLAVALLAGGAAVASTLRAPLVPALRRE